MAIKHQLSQQEIDSFFNSGDRRPDVGAVPFDFRRMDRIPKSQVSAIHFLHDAFVRTFSSSLTVYLRSVVTGSLISVEQLPYSDFAEALTTPTCLVYMDMAPYEGSALVEVSPSLVFPVLDLVLGGNGKIKTEMNREITQMETTLLEVFIQLISKDLHEAWKTIVNVEFMSSPMETRPQLSGRFVPTEAVVAVAMEFKVGESTGMLNLVIPSITLKSMGNKFDPQATARRAENPLTEVAIKRKLKGELAVKVECEYSHEKIRMRDLLNLTAGDVFKLGPGIDEAGDLLVNGVPKMRGYLAVSPKNTRTVVVE
jgi:flagellar motor switch protein FliM